MREAEYVPDLFTRHDVRDIRDQDVSYIDFSGSSFNNGDSLIRLEDEILISKFMSALHESVGREAEFLNRIDKMEIHLRGGEGKPVDPLTLRFYACNPFDCFGPNFQECLNRLSDYHAMREAQRARDMVGKVTEVEIFVGHIANSEFIDDVELVQALLSDLAMVNGKAFAFTEFSQVSCLINVKLDDGTLTKFSLAVTTQPMDALPLPPLLMEYYSYLVAQLPNFLN